MGPSKKQTAVKEQNNERTKEDFDDGEKGRKSKTKSLQEEAAGQIVTDTTEEEKISVPKELPGPPPVVTPELSYKKELTLEQLQDIYAASNVLEEAAKKLANILGLEDNIFDARNLILLDYCLGNLMFAKHAGLDLRQCLMIYDLGHMIMDLIRAKNPFADAERLFGNRLVSLSMIQYRPVVCGDDGPTTIGQNDISKQHGKENINTNAAPFDRDPPSRDEKQGVGKTTSPGGGDGSKSKQTKKKTPHDIIAKTDSKQDDHKYTDDRNENQGNDNSREEDSNEKPLFSSFDLQKIVPYFTSTVFQHYCLYQYCFTKEHYNITRKERVLIETPITFPLIEAKSQEEVDAEEAARVAAIEKARQDAHAAKVRAEQELFDSLAMEARRLAEEELRRRALTLDEYIELSVRHKIEDAKRNILEEYDYREYLLIDKILQRQKEQNAKNGTHVSDKSVAQKTLPTAGKSQQQPQTPAPMNIKKKK